MGSHRSGDVTRIAAARIVKHSPAHVERPSDRRRARRLPVTRTRPMHRDDTPPDPALAFVHVLRSLRELVERRPVPTAACERQARACARLAAAAELQLDDVLTLAHALLDSRLADRRELGAALIQAMTEDYLTAAERLARARPAPPEQGPGEERRAAP